MISLSNDEKGPQWSGNSLDKQAYCLGKQKQAFEGDGMTQGIMLIPRR